MKKIFFFIALAAFMATMSVSCTDYDLIDTGTANGKHECSMWDYFGSDQYNWDSLRVMATYAGLDDIYKGTSQYGTGLTVFGITNHSIRRYLLSNGYNAVKDMPVEDCKRIILSTIMEGNSKLMLDDFISGTASSNPNTVIGTGGKMYKMLSGEELWIYTFREPYGGVQQAGPKKIYIVSQESQRTTEVASCNIETRTGVVHALSYNFNLNDF